MSLIAALCAATVLSGPTDGITAYEKFKHGRFHYHVVTVNMNPGVMTPNMVHSHQLTPAWNMIGDNQPLVAITGTFFNPSYGNPVGDVLVDGNLVAKGARGSGIGVDWYGQVKIFDTRFRQEFDWSSYRCGLRGAIRLVTSGEVHPNPKAQKFRDKRLWGRAARTAIGITDNNKLLFVATTDKVTLSELGRAMVSRGAYNAIGLDGGSSTCLYYNGSMIIKPRRKLSNLFVVTPNPVALAAKRSSYLVSSSR